MEAPKKKSRNNGKSEKIEEKEMETLNRNLGSSIGDLGTLVGNKTMRLLSGLVLVEMLAMATLFGSVSADLGPVH